MPKPRKPSRKASRAGKPIEPTRNKPLLVLVSLAIALAGLGMAYWSYVELRYLVTSLRTDAPVVETMNVVYILPVLALAFLSMAAFFWVELVSGPWAERAGTAVVAVLLGTVFLVFLFGLTGGIANWFLMIRSGYELCDTRSGTRITWTLWAKPPGSCAALTQEDER